jgi:hypothetical protein
MLSGKKTYILAAAGLIYAVAGYFSGHLDSQTALGLLWSSGIVTTVRNAIANVEAKLNAPTTK